MSTLVRAAESHPLGSWTHIEPEWTCLSPKLLGFEDVEFFRDVYRAHVARAIVCPYVGDVEPRNVHRRVLARLSLPGEDARVRFENMFRWHVGTVAHEFGRRHVVAWIVYAFGFVALTALGVLAVPVAAWRTGRLHDVTAVVVGMAAACVPYGLAAAAGHAGNRGRPLSQRTRTTSQRALVAILPVCLVVVAAATFRDGVSSVRFLAGTGLVAGCAVLIVGSLPAMGVNRLALGRWRRWLRRNPREALSYEASAIVHHLTEHSWRWGTTSYMEMLATRIESFAVRTERDIPRYLRPGDPLARHRLEELAREVAAATREQVARLRADRPDEALSQWFVDLLPALAFGRWEDLPAVPAPPVARRPRPPMRAVAVGVLSGVAPLGLLFVLQATSLRLGDPLRSGFAAAFLVHAVVHVYARLGWDDGPYPTLLETIRRLRGGSGTDAAHDDCEFHG